MDIEAISALITAIAALATAIGSMQVILYRIKQLEIKMDKHNNLIERMALREQDDKAQWKAINELKERTEHD